MPRFSRFVRRALLAAGAFALASPVCFADGLSATATYTDTQVAPGLFDYNLTLNNTGTTTIGTFWFSWVPGAGFMPVGPSSVSNPAGWTDTVTNGGAGIRWVTSSPISAGATVSGFNFTSTLTPAQLLGNFTGTGPGAGDPIGTSFAYIGAPLADPGFQFVAEPAVAVAATPEPGSWVLIFTGAALIVGAYRAKQQNILLQ